MQTNQATPNALERRIDMNVSLAEVEKEVESRLKKLSRTVKMPGFRPGKVPMKMVEQAYGPQVRSEAIGAAVEKVFNDQVREQKLRVAGYPQIEPREGGADGALAFSATFEVFPDVTLGDLSAASIEIPKLDVGDAEVERTLDVLRKQRVTYSTVERASQKDDRVAIDFTGRKDGEVFEGGQASDFSVVVGGGQMLPEFDAQLVGLTVGQSETFPLTFPADYHAANLAGQTVEFEITCKRVEVAELPTIDEAFARALGIGDGDVTKMRAEIRANLEREVRRRIQARVRDQVMETLSKSAAFEVPKALIESESQRMAENAKRDLAARGMGGKDLPVEPSWFTEQARTRVKLGLLVAEIVEKHNLSAKAEQVRARVEEMAQSYEKPAEFTQWFMSQRDRLSEVQDVVVEENVVNWVLSQAKASDRVVSFDDLMGNAPAA